MDRPCGNCGRLTDEQELHVDTDTEGDPVCPSCIGVFTPFNDEEENDQ